MLERFPEYGKVSTLRRKQHGDNLEGHDFALYIVVAFNMY
jgi:hypothetical protein